MTTSKHNIVIFGNPAEGQTKTLSTALSSHCDAIVRMESIKGLTVDKLRACDIDLAFVVLGEEQMSSSKEGSISSYKPSPVIDAVWGIIDARLPFPIHIAVPGNKLDQGRGNNFTALDTVAMGLSGIAGIWEISIDLLDDSATWQKDVDTLKTFWRSGLLCLYGKVVDQIYFFHRNINNPWWPSNSSARSIEYLWAKYTFQISLALSIFRATEFPFEEGLGDKPKEYWVKRIVALLNDNRIPMAESVVDKALGYLNKGWEERIVTFEKKKKQKMPIWARLDGFPSHMPLIRKPPDIEISEYFFDIVTNPGFRLEGDDEDWEAERPSFTTILIPNTTPRMRRKRR